MLRVKQLESGSICFIHEEDRRDNLPNRLLQQARETGKAIQEGWRVRKNGSKFWGTIIITALHSKDGSPIGFSKVTRDLTDKKMAEEKLIAYTAELERQNSELEQFAYVASHDLQEPLRKIQTFAGLIQENFDDREFVKKYFEKLDVSAKRMAELVKSLLHYSRLSNYKDPVRPARVDLNEIVEEVKQDFELLIEEKGAVVKSGTLPKINGNHIQLGQLFSNLISNSLKFSQEKPVIKINAETILREDIAEAPETFKNAEYHVISFEDNGIGFEQKYDTIIFSLFQRLHGKQDYAGTGIGLALCKKIVENHGGMIKASSEKDKGAKFEVFLPVN